MLSFTILINHYCTLADCIVRILLTILKSYRKVGRKAFFSFVELSNWVRYHKLRRITKYFCVDNVTVCTVSHCYHNIFVVLENMLVLAYKSIFAARIFTYLFHYSRGTSKWIANDQ